MQGTDVLTKAVVLVGGKGTRLLPLTHYLPKPMVPVLNQPFLAHIIAYLNKYGIDNTVLALSYLPEVIQNYFGDGSGLGVNLTYSLESSPLGTAGAVKNAESCPSGSLLVLNGDVITDLNLAEMFAFHQNKGAKVTIALIEVENPCAFGVVETDSDCRVRNFIEKPGPDRITTHWINAGTYILDPEVLEYMPSNRHCMFEDEIFPLLLKQGEPVYGYPFSGYWLDMGTPGKYLQLNCDLLMSKTRSVLVEDSGENGVCCGKDTVVDATAKITGPTIIASGCKIGKGARIKGPVVIGQDCRISENAVIEETVLWDKVSVGERVSLKGCVIADNVTIKDNDRLFSRLVTRDHTRAIE